MIRLQLTGREGCSSGDGGPDCGRFLRGYRPEHPHFGIQKVTVLLRGRFLTMQDTTSQILPACKCPVWSVHNLIQTPAAPDPVSYTHLRAHETDSYIVCRLLLEKKKNIQHN